MGEVIFQDAASSEVRCGGRNRVETINYSVRYARRERKL